MTKKQETQIWYAYDIAKMTKNIVHSNDYNSVHDIGTVIIKNYKLQLLSKLTIIYYILIEVLSK